MIEVLARIVADTALFLEFGNTADDDVAVRQLESLASRLQLLGPDEKRDLAAELRSISKVETQSDFIWGLPESLGLTA
jgi:hypothetical protein